MDDGEEMDFGPADFMICPPGHDAWIVGDEPCVVIDWQVSPNSICTAEFHATSDDGRYGSGRVSVLVP